MTKDQLPSSHKQPFHAIFASAFGITGNVRTASTARFTRHVPGVLLFYSCSVGVCHRWTSMRGAMSPFPLRSFAMEFRPNRVSIDLSALEHNLGQVRTLVSRGTKIMGIVKSDAYGHGILPVSKALEKSRVDCLGVACLHEAVLLRQNGIKLPIVILCGVLTEEEVRETVARDLTPVVFDSDVAERLAKESARQDRSTRIYVKVDTGMGRLGIPWDEIGPFVERISPLKGLVLEGLASHLSSADEMGGEFTQTQIDRFNRAIDTARSMGEELPFNNLANSAGVMGHRESHFQMIRPGIMLYGGLPSPHYQSPVPLRPAMCFTGRVLQIRDLPDRTPISYGRTYYTNGQCRVAILSAGYGDGLPRGMSNRGHTLIGGKRAPIVGTICMNLTVCDVTHLQGVRVGDEAVLLGTQGMETVTADDMARWSGTISYEVLCSIGQRNKREYLS